MDSLEDELLPGIPNDIAVDEIATKIAAKDICALSLVSPSWQEIIQQRVVYEARVRRCSTETHVVLLVLGICFQEVRLCSLRNKSIRQLPQIPRLRLGYQFIALDGKLYALGGDDHTMTNREVGSRKVFVLDLVGEKQWKECASMTQSRRDFGCGVLGGKIYVFGGAAISPWHHDPAGASEVYDREVDAWFPIKSMKPVVMGDIIVTHIGEELVVQARHLSSEFQAYHPGTDEWREGTLSRFGAPIFSIEGKFYKVVLLNNIDIYDPTHPSSWRYHCTIRCDELGPVGSVIIFTSFVVPANNEVLANIQWRRSDDQTRGYCLLLSSGFGGIGTDVVWRILAQSSQPWSSLMCLVEL